jgi:hypothetical protein
MPVALQGQSGVCPPFLHGVSGGSAKFLDVNRLNPPGAGLSLDSPIRLTARKQETDSEKPDESSSSIPFAASSSWCVSTTCCLEWLQIGERLDWFPLNDAEPAKNRDIPDGVSKTAGLGSKTFALDRDIYYKNRLDFSFDSGWLPINIPFVFDVFLGDGYTMTSLKYTLVPFIGSIRWQIDNVGGPWIFRGNWDLQCSGAATWIPRGPETRYFAWILGIRRNFVPRRGKIAPYFDGRLGLGNIDAKEPLGVLYAQGQDFTFTVNMGSGVRYNVNPRYSISAGLNWMHISNLYLSQPQFANYGINVYGPMLGFNVRLGKPRYQGSE